MDYGKLGFMRVRALAPPVAVADPAHNARTVIRLVREDTSGAAVHLFPELFLSGFTAEDLLFTDSLLNGCRDGVYQIAVETAHSRCLVVVGVPWAADDGRLFNCAAVIAGGNVLGLIPKSALPNYGEFYDRRWFVSGAGVSIGETTPIACRQLFEIQGFRVGVEVCEDLWSPASPGVDHALAGAELILNLSASNELVAKADYRRDLVRMASGQRLCAYLYASAGPSESTKDIVFGGHLMAAENGVLLAESARFELAGSELCVELDLGRLRHHRLQNGTFANAPRPTGYRVCATSITPQPVTELDRPVDAHPFVPDDEHEFDARAAEILAIQATGLARRLLAARTERMVLGLSGGLDSTLALLVCLDAAERTGAEPGTINTLTMPGPGTSEHTLASARRLASAAGVTLKEIDIHAAVEGHLSDLGHPLDKHDVVFENAQARERTQILFDYANQVGGLVVGTGDLSELALGWATYNADHMAGYNVNASVPKTMVAYLVRWYGRHRAGAPLAAVLERVLGTPISPELIPPDAHGITQHTESLVGPYELHDFFLYHYLRNGATPGKIHALARVAFDGRYDDATLRRWMKEFFSRFFSQQFKRTTLPPGPKVGTVSLSPRGDWRMPDEASAAALLAEIDRIPG